VKSVRWNVQVAYECPYNPNQGIQKGKVAGATWLTFVFDGPIRQEERPHQASGQLQELPQCPEQAEQSTERLPPVIADDSLVSRHLLESTLKKWAMMCAR